MPVIDDRTNARGYPLPHPDNDLSDDVLRLIAALNSIDVDVLDIYISLSGKSNIGHSHSIGNIVGLGSALASKAAVDHVHNLDQLTDVSVVGAASGQFLKNMTGTWQPATITTDDVSGLATALQAKADLQGRSIVIPSGTTAQRPPTPAGTGTLLRFNTDATLFEYWIGSAWAPLAVNDVLSRSQNLEDLLDKDAAITNLGAAKADLSNTTGPRGKYAEQFTGDLNTLLENGVWAATTAASNRPAGSSGTLIVRTEFGANGSIFATQYAREYTADSPADGKLWKRERNNNTWGSWYRVRENEAELDNRYARVVLPRAFESLDTNGFAELRQDGTGPVSIPPSGFMFAILDGWNVNFPSGYNVQADLSTDVPSGAGIPNSIRIQATANATGSPDPYARVYHCIEGFRCQILNWGTAYALPFTVGFWVKPDVAATVAQVAAGYSTQAGSSSYTSSDPEGVTALPANVWTFVRRVFQPAVNSPIVNTNATGLRIGIAVLANSGLLFGTTGQGMRIAGLKILPGISLPDSTEWFKLRRDRADEERLVRRYFQKINNIIVPATTAFTTTKKSILFPETMRAAPTLTFSQATGGGSVTFTDISTNGFSVGTTGSSGEVKLNYAIADARLG